MSNNKVALTDYTQSIDNPDATISAASSLTSTALKMGADSIGSEVHWHTMVRSLSGPATLRMRVQDSADGVSYADLFVSPTITPVALTFYIARMNAEALTEGRPFVQLVCDVIGGTNLRFHQSSIRTNYKTTPQNGVHVLRNEVFGAAFDGQGSLEKDSLGNEKVLGDYPASIGL